MRKKITSAYLSNSTLEKLSKASDNSRLTKTRILEESLNNFSKDKFRKYDLEKENKFSVSFALSIDQIDKISTLADYFDMKKNNFLDSLLHNTHILFTPPNLKAPSNSFVINYLTEHKCHLCGDDVFNASTIKQIEQDYKDGLYENWLQTSCSCKKSIEINIQSEYNHIYFKYI